MSENQRWGSNYLGLTLLVPYINYLRSSLVPRYVWIVLSPFLFAKEGAPEPYGEAKRTIHGVSGPTRCITPSSLCCSYLYYCLPIIGAPFLTRDHINGPTDLPTISPISGEHLVN
ncbi:hypothetical protein LZ31DRAFT_179302 [Colletotrichum somersetense]|nr:hypothetical protein LZ31DRAFT_179302 [Colletotrichum somersetense]